MFALQSARARLRFLPVWGICAFFLVSAGSGGFAQSSLPFVLQEVSVLDPGVKNPAGLAFDQDDHLYVAGAAEIRVFDSQHQPLRAIPLSAPATCVAVDDAGAVYAGQKTRVEIFDAQGAAKAVWGREGRDHGQFRHITAIAVKDHFLWIADAGNRRISRFAVNGDFVDDLDGFLIPSPYFDCAFDAQGILHVGHTARHRVERYDRNWKMLGFWGHYGVAPDKFTGCCNPAHLALFPDGRVAVSEKGIPTLKVHDAEGHLLAFLGTSAFPRSRATGWLRRTSGTGSGMDIAVNSKDRIALLEPVSGSVRFYALVPRSSD